MNHLLSQFAKATLPLLKPSLLAVGLLFGARGVQAVPASPDPVVVKQPDGTKLTVFIRGDEWNNWLETPTGEVVLQDSKSLAYVYAQPTAGGKAAPTSSEVGKVPPPYEPFKPKAAPETAVMRAEAAEPAIPLTGTARVLTILVTYSDTTQTVLPAAFDTMLFGSGAGSMKTFYEEMSRGTFSVASGPAGILGWYKAPKTRAYYGQNLASGGQNYPVASELVKDAVLLADAAGVDFAPYDQDNDGNIDVVNIVHQGAGEETSGDALDIWSHRWNLASSGVGSFFVDGKRVNDYIMNPEMAGGAQNTIGVFAHEYGHALGLPDLYDIDGSDGGAQGLGNWSLMAGGSYNRTTGASGTSPAHMDAWCKSRLNWVTPINVTTNQTGVSIPEVRTSGTVYKLRTAQFPANEYFLVENRQKTGFDLGLPSAGLLIYHVDDNMTGSNARQWFPGQTGNGHYRVALEQADGLFNLEKPSGGRGDAGDVWPGSTTKRTFSSSTVPDSKPYNQAATSLAVRNISDSGTNMTADFMVTSAGAGQTVTLISPGESASANNPIAVRATTTKNSAFNRMDFSYRPSPTILSRTPGLAIPDNTTVSDNVNSAASGNIANATLTVNISHTWIADLLVTLVAPDNTRHVVHNRAGGDADNIAQSYNLSTALAGKPQAGAWKLEINDNATGDPGVLNSWSLAFGDPTFIAIGADTDGANASGEWTTNWNTGALPLGNYDVRAIATDTDGVAELEDINTFTLANAPSATSGLIISEFRFHGPTASDEYVELYNTQNTPLDISGWFVRTNTGTAAVPAFQIATVPANTLIPARGHFLFTGAGYTLSSYGASNASLGANVAADSGVALYNAVGAQQDAVGFTSSVTTPISLRENGPLVSAPNVDGQYAFMRDFSGAVPKDTGDSSADWVFLSTNGAGVTGNAGTVAAQLGTPNPEGLASPTNMNSLMSAALLDPQTDQNLAPNRVRTGSGSAGSLLVRRTLKNNSTQAISKIRLMVTRITGQNSPFITAGQADVRLGSTTTQTFPVRGTNVTVYGTNLETPSNAAGTSGTAPNLVVTGGGGGLGSSQSFDLMLSTPLQPNESRAYSFNLQVAKSGNFVVIFNLLGKP